MSKKSNKILKTCDIFYPKKIYKVIDIIKKKTYLFLGSYPEVDTIINKINKDGFKSLTSDENKKLKTRYNVTDLKQIESDTVLIKDFINDDDTNFYTTYDIIIFTLTSQEQKIVKQNKKANKKATDFYIELVKTKDNAKFENTDELLQEILSLFIEIINNDYMNKIEENKKDLEKNLTIYKVNISELKDKVNILKEKKKKLENIIQNEPELNEKYYNEVNKIYEKLDRKT